MAVQQPQSPEPLARAVTSAAADATDGNAPPHRLARALPGALVAPYYDVRDLVKRMLLPGERPSRLLGYGASVFGVALVSCLIALVTVHVHIET